MAEAQQVPPAAVSNTTQFACVNCGYAYTKASNTNPARSGGVRRQRVCVKCSKGFVTYEVTAGDYAVLQALRKWTKEDRDGDLPHSGRGHDPADH